MAAIDPETSATGYTPVVSDISCVLTRFRVWSVWSLIRFYLSFRRVRDSSRGTNGLLVSLFIAEDARTCYTLSLWRDDRAILEFNSTNRAHIDAANACFRHLERGSDGAQLWSAQFTLSAISPHNSRWGRLNLASVTGKVKSENVA